ncbi:MAG: gliding motility protein GldL, partial [Prevotellaceae bacterium]|nr:gliding motility protein GldL [Prevotellaceae bacterium]
MRLLESKFMKRVIAVAYGLGASVVILGALFKLMHWPGAGTMLIAGMSVEAAIFAISVFEALPKEYHWETVFPELSSDTEGYDSQPSNVQYPQYSQHQQHVAGGNVNFDLSIDEATTDELKENIRRFSNSMNQMSGLSNLVSAASDLAGKMYSASGSIVAAGESAGALSDSYNRGSQIIQQLNEQSKAGLEQIHSGYEY